VFSQADSDPHRAVSNGIVQEIRTAGSLIWLAGGASETSVWVNFERDYAARAGVPVFRFDPDASTLERDHRRPVDLTAELIVSANSFNRAVQLMKWLTAERSFSFTQKPTVLRMKEIPSEILRLLERGVPMVWLIDSDIHSIVSLAYGLGDELEIFADDYALCALDGWQIWFQENSIFARISANWTVEFSDDPEEQYVRYERDPVLRAFALGYGLDLIADVDAEGLNWNRADDLVVKLTMLAQRVSPFFPRAGEEED